MPIFIDRFVCDVCLKVLTRRQDSPNTRRMVYCVPTSLLLLVQSR